MTYFRFGNRTTSTKRLRIIIRLALVYCCNSPTGNELLNSVEQGKSYRLEVDMKAEVFISGGRNIQSLHMSKSTNTAL